MATRVRSRSPRGEGQVLAEPEHRPDSSLTKAEREALAARGAPSISPGLAETEDGFVFEHLGADEADFLYEEIFVRNSYFQHGIALQDEALVVDVGAHIGLFALFCRRGRPSVEVLAIEPMPTTVEVSRE